MGGEETIYSAIDSGHLPEEAIDIFDYTEAPHAGESLQLCAEGYWPSAQGALTKNIPDDVGLFIFEGLNAMSNTLMNELASLAATGQGKFGQDTPIAYSSGKLKEGGNPPSHFGIVQRKMLRLIEETRRLPGWVLFTAHETEGEDKAVGDNLIGPAVAGKALTTKIGGSFGNTIHLDSASKKTESKDPVSGKSVSVLTVERRAYFTEHFDPDGLTLKKYFANNRAFDSSRLPACGYITPPDPIRFYQLLKGSN
jgi:hypothetical protein